MKKIMFCVCLCMSGCFGDAIDSWTLPRFISDLGIGSPYPKIEMRMNNNGHAVVAWSEYASNQIVAVVSFDAGDTWTLPILIAEITNVSERNIALSMNDSGYVVVLWKDGNGNFPPNNYIYESHSFNGGFDWSDPFLLSDSLKGVDAPQVVLNDSGQSIAIWEELDVTGYIVNGIDIKESHVTNIGDSWPPATSVNTTGFFETKPKIAMNSKGEAIVVWTHMASASQSLSIQKNTTSDGGVTWGTNAKISDVNDDTKNPTDSEVVLNDLGDGIVVWNQTPSLLGRETHTVNAGASFSTPIDLDPFAASVSLAINNSGQAVVTWVLKVLEERELKSKYNTTPGAGINLSDSQVLFSSNVAIDAVDVEMNNNGVSIIGFRENDVLDNSIKETHSFDGGISWNLSKTLFSTSADMESLEVMLNNNAQAIMVWRFDFFPIESVQEVHSPIPFYNTANQLPWRGLFQKNLINKLSWDIVGGAVLYRIYADSALTDMLYEGTNTFFCDCNTTRKGVTKNYYLTYIDDNDNESIPVEILVP